MKKVAINLTKPLPARNECLPHAAMMLGSMRGLGVAPPVLVSRLVIEPHMDGWVFHRLDDRGGFVGDSWHATREDALWQAKREFDVRAEELQ